MDVWITCKIKSRKRDFSPKCELLQSPKFSFAEKVGQKMQKKDDEFVHEFCNEIGVDCSVLKVCIPP
jgi:ZF-HD class homeobox domain-containing protein